MPTADTPPAISRLDLDGLGELRLQIRRAVHDLRLRAEFSRNEVLLSFAVREFIVLDGPKDPPVRQQDAAPKVIVQY